jgi:hypothetical protein
MKPDDDKGVSLGLLFPKEDILSTEDLIKELKEKYNGNLKIMPVIEKKSYTILEDMYVLGVEKICFEFKPDDVLTSFNKFVEVNTKKEEKTKITPYVINFYESLGTFFIDISGELKKEKITSLKMMFTSYLANKLTKLKGIVYIFNNAIDTSVNFTTIWALMRIWKGIGYPYNRIFFLTTSDEIKKRIEKYVGELGVKYYPSLLDIVKIIYPEVCKKSEMEIFEMAASLLECDSKNDHQL